MTHLPASRTSESKRPPPPTSELPCHHPGMERKRLPPPKGGVSQTWAPGPPSRRAGPAGTHLEPGHQGRARCRATGGTLSRPPTGGRELELRSEMADEGEDVGDSKGDSPTGPASAHPSPTAEGAGWSPQCSRSPSRTPRSHPPPRGPREAGHGPRHALWRRGDWSSREAGCRGAGRTLVAGAGTRCEDNSQDGGSSSGGAQRRSSHRERWRESGLTEAPGQGMQRAEQCLGAEL